MTVIGRNAPSLMWPVGSSRPFTVTKVAVDVTASDALTGPRRCGEEPVKSTVRAEPATVATTATRTGSGAFPSESR